MEQPLFLAGQRRAASGSGTCGASHRSSPDHCLHVSAPLRDLVRLPDQAHGRNAELFELSLWVHSVLSTGRSRDSYTHWHGAVLKIRLTCMPGYSLTCSQVQNSNFPGNRILEPDGHL